jgi:hypothetical protein
MKLSIITILPAAGLCGLLALTGCGSSSNGPQQFTQVDRLARPAVNEVFATVANNRHQVNDQDNPTDDSGQLANDIQSFMVGTAGRSQAITDVVKAVLVPDVMKANLNQTGPAAYLAVETNGATGGGAKFGGRALTDDVVDTSLNVIFGSTIPNLGLAADDDHEITTLTSDHVDASGKHFTATFPYLGAPK